MGSSSDNRSAFAKALLDPAGSYSAPEEVVHQKGLSKGQKVEVLRRWEYEVKELEVAEEEGLGGSSAVTPLEAVLAALHALGAKPDLEHNPPTKQGGV